MPATDAPSSGSAAAPRVVLYVRAGCHLCAEARPVVARECADAGADWAEVDVDSAVGPDGRPVAERYGELVPVVEVDGRRVAYWQVDAARLREALHQTWD